VAASPAKTVEFDRELLESMAKMALGRETLRRVQERNAVWAPAPNGQRLECVADPTGIG